MSKEKTVFIQESDCAGGGPSGHVPPVPAIRAFPLLLKNAGMSKKETKRKSFSLGRLRSSRDVAPSSTRLQSQSTSPFFRWTARRRNEEPEPPKVALPPVAPKSNGAIKTHSAAAVPLSLGDVPVSHTQSSAIVAPFAPTKIVSVDHTQPLNQERNQVGQTDVVSVVSTPIKAAEIEGPKIKRAVTTAIPLIPVTAKPAPIPESSSKTPLKVQARFGPGSSVSGSPLSPNRNGQFSLISRVSVPPKPDSPATASHRESQIYPIKRIPIRSNSTKPGTVSDAESTADIPSLRSNSIPAPAILSTAIYREVKSTSTTTSALSKKKLMTILPTQSSPPASTSGFVHPVISPAISDGPPCKIPISGIHTDPNGIVIRVTTPASAQTSRAGSKPTLLVNDGRPISLSTTLHQLKSNIAGLLELENVQLSRWKPASSSKSCNCAFAENIARNGLWDMLRCRDHTRTKCDYPHPDNSIIRKGICTLCLLDLVERCGDCQDAGIVTRDCCPLVVNAGCNHTFHHHCYSKQFGNTCPARCSTGRSSPSLSC